MLHRYLDEAVASGAERTAIVEASGQSIDYRTLGALSDGMRDRLIALGVSRGDRVGIYMRKSVDTVAAIFGILKAGAAYVPVDPGAPASRDAFILADCRVRAVVVESRFEAPLRDELVQLGFSTELIVTDPVGGGAGLRAVLERMQVEGPAPCAQSVRVDGDDLAYVLYTSGSTGRPKGVTLTHGNAMAFVEWCVRLLAPTADDRFSSHAPFHFDLSILDLYVPVTSGAAIVLIPEDVGKEPNGLAALISETGITIWYSAPSILALLVQFGKLATHDYAQLRAVLFAGEVFPVAHLRALTRIWSKPRYLNLYGPTETNVCTHYEVSLPVPEDRTDPYPIGRVCDHLAGVVVDMDGAPVARGAEGELLIRGPNVTSGYWNLPELTGRAFAAIRGERWYRTGDLVSEEPDGNLRFLGRRDRMVKKRGYRIELGEIEACLYRHPEVQEVAVVALQSESAGLLVRAHLATKGGTKLGTIELKKFCAQHIPIYMIPDTFHFHAVLPKTSTDKIDYQALKARG